MRSTFRKKKDDFDLKIESSYRKHVYRKKAKLRLKRMNGGYRCDKEYKELVIPYWSKYGYKPQKYWYSIFSDREKKVDPRYIPDDLYYGEIIPYFSNSLFRRFGEDKCYHDVWIPNIKKPKTICKNIAGVYYSPEMIPITQKQSIELIMEQNEELIIKPSIDSGEGRMIRFFNPIKEEENVIKKYLNELGSNFIIQEVVKQHPILAKLNPSSLNTIRIVSFFFNNEVHILSSIVRMGAPDSKVDNVGAGGYACPIKPNGQLNDRAVNRKAEWVEKNNYGIKFSEIIIPEYINVLNAVKSAHLKLAHFKLIGWDMSVDCNNEPVFIEFNTCPGSNQITCGPTFGNLTEEVLNEFFINKTLLSAQN